VLGLRWRPRHPLRTGFFAIAAWPVLLVAFGAGGPVALVLLLAAATGMGFALFDVWWNTAMAERIPPHALSRVSSYDWMGRSSCCPWATSSRAPWPTRRAPGSSWPSAAPRRRPCSPRGSSARDADARADRA
jgi:hypothetical protein